MFPRYAEINQNTVCNVTDLYIGLSQIHVSVTYMYLLYHMALTLLVTAINEGSDIYAQTM